MKYTKLDIDPELYGDIWVVDDYYPIPYYNELVDIHNNVSEMEKFQSQFKHPPPQPVAGGDQLRCITNLEPSDNDLYLIENFWNIRDAEGTYKNYMANPPRETKLEPRTRLQTVDKGYYYGPHTDSKFKLLSCIVYIAPEENYGTTFTTDIDHGRGERKESNSIEKGWREYTEHDYTIEWKPNSGYFFYPSDKSYHWFENKTMNDFRSTTVLNIARG